LEGNDGTVESSLVTKFFDEKLPGMTKPEVLTTQGPVLLLQQKEEVAHQTENDEFYLLDDPKVRWWRGGIGNGKSQSLKCCQLILSLTTAVCCARFIYSFT
jgi:hypothetical protein